MHKSVLFASLSLFACKAATTVTPVAAAAQSKYTLTWVNAPTPVMPLMQTFNGDQSTCLAVHVTSAETGVAQQSNPIPGIGVVVKSNKGSHARLASPASTKTDNDGMAYFCDVSFSESGAELLSVEAEGAAPLLSDPFDVASHNVTVNWVVQPQDTVAGAFVRGSAGACPSVLVTQFIPVSDDGADSAAARPGQPIGGIVVKGGKNPGGSLFTATTGNDGVAQFCDIIADVAGPQTLTAEVTKEGNPLYSGGGTAGTNPLSTSRFSRVVVWTAPPTTTAAGKGFKVPATVTVYNAAGVAVDGSLDVTPGTVAANVDVTIERIPDGSTFIVTTDQNGVATITDPGLTNAGAFNLRALADGARSVMSLPVLVQPAP